MSHPLLLHSYLPLLLLLFRPLLLKCPRRGGLLLLLLLLLLRPLQTYQPPYRRLLTTLTLTQMFRGAPKVPRI